MPGFLLLFIYLSPVYLLAAWPIIKWVKKVNSSDVEITEKQAESFRTDKELVRPVREVPRLPEVGSAPVQDDPDDTGEGRMLVKYSAPAGRKGGTLSKEDRARRRAQIRNRFIRETGAAFERGDANLVESVLNSTETVKLVLSLPGFKKTLKTPKKLIGNVQSSKSLAKLLANENIVRGLENASLVAAVVRSDFMKQLARSPVGRTLAKDPNLFRRLLDADPALGNILTHPNVVAAMQINKHTARLGKMARRFALQGRPGSAK